MATNASRSRRNLIPPRVDRLARNLSRDFVCMLITPVKLIFCTSINSRLLQHHTKRFVTIQTYIRRKMVKKQLESGDGPVKELDPLPSFIEERQKLWEKFKEENDKLLASKPRNEITVNVKAKDGNVKTLKGKSWTTTPYELSKEVGPKSWADTIVISKVNGKLWDLNRPLEDDNCSIEYLTFEDHEGQQVFWHSTAHMLGEACERIYGGHLCYGPPIVDGFYYDMFMTGDSSSAAASGSKDGQEPVESVTDGVKDLSIDGSNAENSSSTAVVSTTHFPIVEKVMEGIKREAQPFERLELSKEQLLEMFKYNEFKVRILKEKVKQDRTTVYRCGTLIDLCLGPHVRNTGCVKAFKVTKSSSSLWEGKLDAEKLQRVYGISFPESKQLKEWEKFQKEAAERDHRKLGREQGLFFFHELSPGSCFFTQKGAHIYNKLVEYIRSEYRKRGYTEVISPNIFNSKLWETSGHWQHYSENMFSFDVEKETYALKPMNCPGHCLIFDSTTRSYRDLPLRLAEFGVLHRNEVSGSLTGLTRVRRFVQDDAHLFCAKDQVEKEVTACLDFLKSVYNVFNFTFDLCLSTRPEKFMGEIEAWNAAEAALSKALDASGSPWTINAGDGAFYGPKIDITIKDALRRPFQCGTVQLDFQLPINFKLKYRADDGTLQRPVIIHRAILGSVERLFAILTENYAGKWPFWISPRQVIVLPIGPSVFTYASSVQKQLFEAGFQADIELDPGLTIQKKVRNAQLSQYNFILVVGDREAEAGTVNVRTRDNKQHGEVSLQDLIIKFNKYCETKVMNAEEFQ